MQRRLLASLWLLCTPIMVGAQEAHDADEIARKLSNPVASLWSMKLESSLTFNRGTPSHSYRGEWATKFQPVTPLPITEDWNLILRPVFTFINTPVQKGSSFDRTSGIGDTSVIALASPAKPSGKLVWGVGPTFMFPMTTRDEVSSRKYAAGPAGVGLYMSKKWVLGLFPQYWWSFSGSDKRREVSQANVQYFIWRSLVPEPMSTKSQTWLRPLTLRSVTSSQCRSARRRAASTGKSGRCFGTVSASVRLFMVAPLPSVPRGQRNGSDIVPDPCRV